MEWLVGLLVMFLLLVMPAFVYHVHRMLERARSEPSQDIRDELAEIEERLERIERVIEQKLLETGDKK